MRILFVCSGNICRSPMAAAYCQHKVVEMDLRGVFVESAGTLGIDDAPASREAVEAMREIGVDLTGHRSRGLRRSHVEGADLVIAMTRGHLADMEAWPVLSERRELIRAYEAGPVARPDPPDLADPIGHGIDFYREVRGIITHSIDHLLESRAAPRRNG
jgi:protein-tyrosine-phosphatase